jgi:heat shock protein HslJ
VNRLAVLLWSAVLAMTLAGCASAAGGGSGGPGSSSTGSTAPSGPGGSPAPGTGGSASQDITGGWQLVSGTDSKGAISPGAAAVTFTINGTSSGGHGPCNSFGATTRGSTTGQIDISIGIHTDIACVDPDVMTTESRYFAALNRVTNAALADGTLTLSGGGDTLVFSKGTP